MGKRSATGQLLAETTFFEAKASQKGGQSAKMGNGLELDRLNA
jgi:hypothetical protein